MIIYLSNGNGDIVMSIPALKKIQERSPDTILVLKNSYQRSILNHAKIDLNVIYFPDRRILSVVGFLLKILSFRLRKGKLKIYAPLIPYSFSTKVFSWIVPLRFVFNSNLGWKKSLPMEGTEKLHQVKEMLAFFSRAGVINLDGENISYPAIFPKKEKRNKKVAIGFTCGIAERHKIPSSKFFSKVINLITEIDPDYKIIMPFTASEFEWFKEIESLVNKKENLETIVDMSFSDLVEVLSECDFGVSGTTGQGHTFSYVGLPTICLCGVADYRKSGPYIDKIYPVELKLECAPCYVRRFSQGCGRMDCMDLLDLREVKKHIQTLMQ